ncbi:AroB 3-dehydroquinate synthetase [Candidatus Planktophila dulcis]
MGGQLQEVSKGIKVNSRSGSYSIFFGSRFDALNFGPNHVFIADSFFRDVLTGVESTCIFVEANEKNKTLESVVVILAKLHSLGATKGTRIIALGGGIVQDLATLVASLYMRGLKWTYVPTTKMAQFDSCIGGKSSINLGGVKNIVGNIYPPSEIYIDESFEETLNHEAIASGYLEAIKISYAFGSKGFNAHLELAKSYSDCSKIPSLSLCELVLNQKKRFVEDDEFDSGVRQLLNFGHTFAHAIESATDYRIQHGLAVGMGMIMAMNHPDAVIMENEIRLKKAILNLLKFAGKEAYADIQMVEEDAFIRAFRADKKHSIDSFYLILPVLGGLEKKSFDRSTQVEKVLLNILEATKRELANELR